MHPGWCSIVGLSLNSSHLDLEISFSLQSTFYGQAERPVQKPTFGKRTSFSISKDSCKGDNRLLNKWMMMMIEETGN